MPCPASYEERRLVELDYSTSRLNTEIAAFKKQLHELAQLLETLPAGAPDAETRSAMLKIQELLVPEAEVFKEAEARPEDVFSAAYIESYEREEQFLIRFHEHCELTLCILRTWIMDQFWDNHAAFNAEFEREKALHLLHRKEEHQLKIQNMKDQLSEQEKLLAVNPTFEYQIKMVKGTKMLLWLLEAVSEEALLRNRYAGRPDPT